MNPALAELAVTPSLLLTGTNGAPALGNEIVPSAVNVVFQIPSDAQPQAAYCLEFAGVARKI